MKKNILVSGIIVLQLTVIVIFGFVIHHKKTRVLGEMYVVPVPKENFVKSESRSLTSFYEPAADRIMHDDPEVPIGTSYTINKDSLNDRYNYLIDKPENTYRIVTIGDSFTFGAFVPTADNWAEKLEDMLVRQCNRKNYEVINTGVGGYDVQYGAERYKIRGEKYNPDLIIWLLKDDDFTFISELYMSKSLEYQREMEKDPDYENKYTKKGNYSPGLGKAAMELFNQYSVAELYERSSEHLIQFVKTYNRRLLLAILPNVTIETENAVNAMRSDMVSIFKIPTDIYVNEKYYYPDDRHPTVQGHKVIAQDLYNYITSSSLIPCN